MTEDKAERPPFFKSVRNYFREYCNCSSIHGFRYFGEKRTHFERVWWFVVFSVTLAACIISIGEVYKKWIVAPVIVSFATKGTPIYSIPFPGVTICPETKSARSQYNHFSVLNKIRNKQNLTKKETDIWNYMGLICDGMLYRNYSESEFFTEDFYKAVKEMNINNYPLLKCVYMGTTYNCSEIFKPIITDEGLCYSFNMLDKSEIYSDDVYMYSNFHKVDILTHKTWSMSDGYSESADLNSYPRRALLPGAKNSLAVSLYVEKKNLDYSCEESLQGFRVSLHIPSRVPRPSQEYFRVPLNEMVLAAIQPDMITTDASVKLYNAQKRECFFQTEKKLKFFKLYSSRNCQMECLANYTLLQCGCVNFFMPRTKSTRICGVSKLKCMHETENSYELKELLYKISKQTTNSTEREGFKYINETMPKCDCLPMCSDLSYNVETSQGIWEWKETFKVMDDYSIDKYNLDDYHVSRLILFFKSAEFITSERHELYGPTDFLANFGGLLGLFTGFSILSLMEAIYFLTVRLCCNTRLYGYWAGPEK